MHNRPKYVITGHKQLHLLGPTSDTRCPCVIPGPFLESESDLRRRLRLRHRTTPLHATTQLPVL